MGTVVTQLSTLTGVDHRGHSELKWGSLVNVGYSEHTGYSLVKVLELLHIISATSTGKVSVKCWIWGTMH